VDGFNLKALEDLGVQLFELLASLPRTCFHLVVKPRRVFESLKGGGGQEEYGDGAIGYTSPILFALSAVALQTAIDWSTSFYAASEGLSEVEVSTYLMTYCCQVLLFAFVLAIVATGTLGRHRDASTLHLAFNVGCYGSGLGLLRTLSFTAAAWLTFFGSVNRGGDSGSSLLQLSTLFTLAGGGFLVWQLAVVAFGFIVVLEMSRRTALWVMVKAVAWAVPLAGLLYLLLSPQFVTVAGRLWAAKRAVEQHQAPLALDHLEYLARAPGYEGSRSSVALQQLQLETRTYRQWLPAYERLRERLEATRRSAADSGYTTSVRVDLVACMQAADPVNMSTQPLRVIETGEKLAGAIARQRQRITEHFLTSTATPRWPFPHPLYVKIALSNCLLDRADRPRLLERLDHALLCLDVGILTMLERLSTVGERVPVVVEPLKPAVGMHDVLMSLMIALCALG
jgi:hypothetical protein